MNDYRKNVMSIRLTYGFNKIQVTSPLSQKWKMQTINCAKSCKRFEDSPNNTWTKNITSMAFMATNPTAKDCMLIASMNFWMFAFTNHRLSLEFFFRISESSWKHMKTKLNGYFNWYSIGVYILHVEWM